MAPGWDQLAFDAPEICGAIPGWAQATGIAGVRARLSSPRMAEITEWLARARGGDSGALARVFEALYPELRRLPQARAAAGERTLTPTALVHEAYLKLLGSASLELDDRRHFLA